MGYNSGRVRGRTLDSERNRMVNRHNSLLVSICVTVTLAMLGCTEPDKEEASNNAPPPPPVVVVEPATSTADGEQPPAEPVREGNEVTAEVGFGEKGHYDSQDYISVAVSSQFRAQEQLTLLRITDAMRKHKAAHGHFPKTDEEFFEDVIEANSISLPELPAGQKFGYDPDAAEENDGEDALTILKPK